MGSLVNESVCPAVSPSLNSLPGTFLMSFLLSNKSCWPHGILFRPLYFFLVMVTLIVSRDKLILSIELVV